MNLLYQLSNGSLKRESAKELKVLLEEDLTNLKREANLELEEDHIIRLEMLFETLDEYIAGKIDLSNKALYELIKKMK